MSTRLPSDCLPLTQALSHAIEHWSTCQRAVVDLAIQFAESGEWAASGSRTAAQWIAGHADVEVSTAREWIRVGRRLRVLPAIAEAFGQGVVSYSKVRTLTRLATPENEHELLPIAERVAAGHLGRALAAWVQRNSGADELERLQHQQRSLTWRTEPDGMVVFTARHPPLPAATLISRLTTGVMTSRVHHGPVENWPTLAQQHADALERILTDDTGGGTVTEIVLHVRGDGCTLDDGTPIPESVIERIAPHSYLRALIHDADGRPINASSRRRHPTDRQKRVVHERDRACVDCGSTQLLEYDHVPDFAQTGHTMVDELVLRCAPCHRHRHEAA